MLILSKKPKLLPLINKDGQIQPFELNLVQSKILKKIQDQVKERGRSRLIIIKSRQQGVTTFLQLLALSYVLTEPAFSAYTMAHDSTIANDIFEKKIKFAFDNLHPTIKAIYKPKRDNTRQLMFEGDLKSSNITVGLSARGTTQNFLHISEAGKMSLNPKLWTEMITGSLPAAENAKIIVIESTADGGQGPFYQLVQDALNGLNEFEVLFQDWTDSPEYQLEPPLTGQDWREDYKKLALRHSLPLDPRTTHNLTESQFYWYTRQVAKYQGDIKKEYPLDLDQAFEINVTGSYYQDQIDQMNEEGRFSDNPLFAYNPKKEVITYWDLAVSHDLNAVLFVQEDGQYINIIDYYERTGVPAQQIADDLFSRNYLYGQHFAPHDVATKQMDETALRTKQDIFRSVGINFSIVGRTSFASGIEAVRLLFPRLRIHKNENTILFMNRLRSYRSEDKQGLGVTKEVHDINSHAADSLKYMCIQIGLNKELDHVKQKAKHTLYKQLKPVTF